jgi:hypothetical protein
MVKNQVRLLYEYTKNETQNKIKKIEPANICLDSRWT